MLKFYKKVLTQFESDFEFCQYQEPRLGKEWTLIITSLKRVKKVCEATCHMPLNCLNGVFWSILTTFSVDLTMEFFFSNLDWLSRLPKTLKSFPYPIRRNHWLSLTWRSVLCKWACQAKIRSSTSSLRLQTGHQKIFTQMLLTLKRKRWVKCQLYKGLSS